MTSSLSRRLSVLEMKITDNVPPESIKVLMPVNYAEQLSMREQYKDIPHIMVITTCARKCDNCADVGQRGCRNGNE